MINNSYPILEFDPSSKAIINPQDLYKEKEAPTRAVICFFGYILEEMNKDGNLTLLRNIRSEMGLHPLYLYQHKGETVLLFHPGVGAPLAAAILEETIQLGASIFIACGGCGVLDHHLETTLHDGTDGAISVEQWRKDTVEEAAMVYQAYQATLGNVSPKDSGVLHHVKCSH